MTAPALIREAEARRLAKVAKQIGVAVTVDRAGNVTFTPMPEGQDDKQVAHPMEIRL
jgi:hypothetical protein